MSYVGMISTNFLKDRLPQLEAETRTGEAYWLSFFFLIDGEVHEYHDVLVDIDEKSWNRIGKELLESIKKHKKRGKNGKEEEN